jgi:RNA polymerase sigma factor (sigma-70 family)
MQNLDDLTLLREYAARGSEAAFAELVSRRVGFVYAAALRQVRDPHLAEEITQAVFIILAQKAGKISDQTILAGWLFKTTRYAAIAQTREITKRSLRQATLEQEVQMQTELSSAAPDPLWERMSPLLDEALAALGETDRQAVLLRFFENKSLAEVGRHLGTGEDTARKRVTRALEKLHRHFSKRGVSSTTAIIAGAMSANSMQAAPVALAKSVTAVAIAKGAAASGSTLTLIKGALKIMAWTKMKTAAVTAVAVILAAGTTTFVIKTAAASRAKIEKQIFSNGLNNAQLIPGAIYTYHEGDEKTHHYIEAVLKHFYNNDPTRIIKTDNALTEEDIQTQTIFIYGSPQNHAFFQRVRDQLPIVFEDDGVVVGKKKFRGQDVGAIFECPNPLSPRNRLIVYGTVSPDALNDMNSIFHGPTDYIVFNNTTRQFRGVNDNERFLVVGAFDKTAPAHWRVDEKLELLPPKNLQRAITGVVAAK